MRIERYTGRDTRDAMAQVRAHLGSQAYILANRRVDGRVELTAALDIEAAVEEAQRDEAPRGGLREPVTTPGAKATGNGELRALEQELHRLRGILETELGERSWRDVATRPPVQSTVRQRLLRLGLSRTLADQLLERTPRNGSLEQLWRLAMAGLERRLERLAGAIDEHRVTAIYGGTGVGKTSTIAKLAGRDLRRYGVDGVGLITMDGYRIGAQEQLASFADALRLPLIPVTDARSLREAVRSMGKRRIYIDTAGMNQHDHRLQAQQLLVQQACPEAGHLLALAASAQPAQCRAIVDAFSPGSLSGAIITKVDEAQSLGGIMDVLLGARLAVHGITEGQRVPEDIAPLEVDAFLERAVALASPRTPPTTAPGGLAPRRASA